MKHIAGSLAVLAVALSFSYADSGDADLMKKIHQESGTGVVAECKALNKATKEFVKTLETTIKTNVKDFKVLHKESLVSFVDSKNTTTMKAFVTAKQTARDTEKMLRNEFADKYSERKDLTLQASYATRLVTTQQAMYDSIRSLVATGSLEKYNLYVKDAMSVVNKNKTLRLEIIMKRIDMMLKCGQGKHDKVIQLIDRVMTSEMSASKKQQFLARTTLRMNDMKKKLEKTDKKRGAAFNGAKDDKYDMIDDVLDSVERASSELEDEKIND